MQPIKKQANRISISVCYVTEGIIYQKNMILPKGTTVERAVIASGILQQHPEIDLQSYKTGVYSQFVPLQHVLEDGSRVEIYTPAKGKRPQKNKAR